MSSILNLPTLVADPTAETETLDSFADVDVAEAAGPVREVRTLHEPPEIWDLVPEAPKRFNRSSALVVRLTSMKPLLLALIVIGGGGAVFGYINWGNWSGVISGVSSLLKEPGPKTSSSLRATVPEKPPAPSEDPRTDSREIAPTTQRTNVATTTIEPKPLIVENPAASVNPTAEQVATPALVPAKSSVTKTPRLSKTNSEPTVARAVSKQSQLSNETPAPSDDNGRANSTAAKHADERTQGPTSSAPAKATSTPKGKVIQWP
jgi:hypothetical protein